jgi:hypothetical protein
MSGCRPPVSSLVAHIDRGKGSQETIAGSHSPSAIPIGYQGAWRGNILYGTTSDRVSMTLDPGAVGAQVGMFTNYALGYQRSAYLEGDGGPIYLRLVATSASAGTCAPFVYARATSTSGGLNMVMEDASEVVPTDPGVQCRAGSRQFYGQALRQCVSRFARVHKAGSGHLRKISEQGLTGSGRIAWCRTSGVAIFTAVTKHAIMLLSGGCPPAGTVSPQAARPGCG